MLGTRTKNVPEEAAPDGGEGWDGVKQNLDNERGSSTVGQLDGRSGERWSGEAGIFS